MDKSSIQVSEQAFDSNFDLHHLRKALISKIPPEVKELEKLNSSLNVNPKLIQEGRSIS